MERLRTDLSGMTEEERTEHRRVKGREKAARWRAANPEKHRAVERARYWADPEEARAKLKARREADPEKYAAQQHAKYWANPEGARAYARAHRTGFPEKIRDAHLQSHYGISLEEFNKRFEEQGSCCGICKTTVPGKRDWATDHNHQTGAVRGILCSRCNLGGGHFNDDPVLLRKAADWFSR